MRLQAHGGFSQNLKLFYLSPFISLTVQWENKNPKVFLLVWFPFLNFAQGIF